MLYLWSVGWIMDIIGLGSAHAMRGKVRTATSATSRSATLSFVFFSWVSLCCGGLSKYGAYCQQVVILVSYHLSHRTVYCHTTQRLTIGLALGIADGKRPSLCNSVSVSCLFNLLVRCGSVIVSRCSWTRPPLSQQAALQTNPTATMMSRMLSPLVVLSLVLLLSFIPLTSSLLTNPFTSADTTRIVSDLSRQQPFDDAQSIHSHLHTLSLLHQPLPKADKAVTATLNEALSSSDVADVHYAVAALQLLGQKPAVPAKQLTTLSSALGSSNLVTLYHAISALIVLRDTTQLSLADYNIPKALTTLASLEELDHTYRLSPRAEDGNLYYTALVYEVLAGVVKGKVGGTGVEKQAKDALGHSKTVLATDRSYGLPVHVSQLQAVGAFVAGVGELSSAVGEKVSWSKKEVEEMAEYLLGNRYTSDVDEVHAVVAGLHSIASFPDNVQPAVVSVGSDGLKATVSNVLGAAVKGSSVSTSISSAEGKAIDSGKWSSATPGLYTATHTVDGSHVALPLRKTTTVKSLSASITITDSPKAADKDDTVSSVTYPAVLGQPYSADGSKYVYVRVTVDCDVTPSQVVVLFTRTTSAKPDLDSNATTATPFTARKAGDAYVARINVGSLDVMEALGGGGSFIVHVLVGDVLLDEPIDWPLANLELTLPRITSASTLDQPVVPIAHTFRPTDHKRSYLLPLLFTGALIAVFAALVLRVLAITSIELPPAAESVWALAFQGCMVGLMVLYVLYWLRLNIFQALTGSVVLAIAAVLTGNKALTALHIRKSKLHVE